MDDTWIKDTRASDIGLSHAEASYVKSLCKKYTNYRDTLDDVYQTCLIALNDALSKAKTGVPITHRKAFIRRVTYNTLNWKYIQNTKSDLLYKCTVPMHGKACTRDDIATEGGSYNTSDILDETDLARVETLPYIGDLDTQLTIRKVMEEVLTQEEIDLLLAFEVGGYYHRELAEATNMPKGRISVKIARARAKLVEALAIVLSPEDM